MRVLGPVLVSVVVALLAAAPARAALPDLVADQVGTPVLQHDGDRRLLRFDGYVHNAGLGRLEVEGTERVGTEMTSVIQRVFNANGTVQEELDLPDAEVVFEDDDDHYHWHLQKISTYSLRHAGGGAEAAPPVKVGFCLLDSQHRETDRGPREPFYVNESFCEAPDASDPNSGTNASSVTQGVSAGWRDVYTWDLAFQWVDVSNVAPGNYAIRAEADAEDDVVESNEVNPPADRTYTLPGWRAKPNAVDVGADGTAPLTLGADQFGSGLAAPRFRIETAPERGDVVDDDGDPIAAGTWFADASVRYVRDAGATAGDALTFSATEQSNPFPTTPPKATVTFSDAEAPPLELSGVPGELVAGAAAQLRATVDGRDPAEPVTWSVDGVVGGSALSGTISPDGLYAAPQRPPLGGFVTVRASVPSGASAEARIRIVPRPVPKPSPLPPDAPGGPVTETPSGSGEPTPEIVEPPRPRPAIKLRALRTRRYVVASAFVRRTGRLRLSVLAGKRRLATCTPRVRAGRLYSCRLRLRRPVARSLRVVATLRSGGRSVQARRKVPKARAAVRGHRHRHS